jgi:sugar phosphate isomerase/epimerase
MKKTWSWAACGYNLLYEEKSDNTEVIELCKGAGIQAVEANPFFSEGRTDAEIEEIRKAYGRAGIVLSSFHLPFSAADDVSAFYETQRRQTVERMIRMLENAALLGSRVVILHPSTSACNLEDEGIDRYLLQLGKSLDTMVPRAEKLGLTIALENMLHGLKGSRLASRPEHFRLFAKKLGRPHLGFCLDTGHALIAGGPSGPADFFDAMAEHLAAFHVQDNTGDRDLHLAPGHGFVDWEVVFRRMAGIKFSHPVCIEAPPFSPADHYRYSSSAWKKMIEETDALAEKSIK